MISVISTLMCLFTLLAVNFRIISQPQSELAIFVGFGLVLCFLSFPTMKKDYVLFKYISWGLAAAAAFCCLFIVTQLEPAFSGLWLKPDGADEPANLGNRAGAETRIDIWISIIGVILVLEATRRSIGWIVPILAFTFMAHSYLCTTEWEMPEWLLPHKGQSIDDIAVKTFMQLGVFGDAAKVMFKFVFLFVLFGAFLELSGATKFIISFSDRVFSAVTGGPAMVSVLGSALMGTLSGSAVANAVTTGSFTIPMMRKSGFKPHIAGGIMAAAASGGALVPPVMGAGAYMMAELLRIDFLYIAIAAMIPAVLYYTSILLIVFLHARQIERRPSQSVVATIAGFPRLIKRICTEFLLSFSRLEGVVFFTALVTLIGLLIAKKTAFRAVSASIVVILLFSAFRSELKLSRNARWSALGVFALVGLLYAITLGGGMPNSFDKGLDLLLSSSIAGVLAMMVFGLIQPEWRKHILEAFNKSAKNGVSLVAASACVGIIIAIVTSTGIAFTLSARIAAVVESNLLLALLGIMGCSLILGMGVPSVVCYLLVVTLMGPLLEQLGVTPLAAHLFIFYFGMMSMVTPPVALAAYASASIAQAPVMRTAFAAFRFALVGFTLPFMFIYNPSLLLLPLCCCCCCCC